MAEAGTEAPRWSLVRVQRNNAHVVVEEAPLVVEPAMSCEDTGVYSDALGQEQSPRWTRLPSGSEFPA